MYTPKEIAENYITIAKTKTSLVWYRNLILAVLAGIFIAIAGVLATIAGSAYSDMQSTLIKASVFPIGLVLVTLAGSELFTGNCLLVAPLLQGEIKVTKTLKNLGITYAGNLVGSILIALIAVYSGALDQVAASVVSAAVTKCNFGFGKSFLLAIPCNILVCLAVWISMSSKSAAGKILAVYMPIFAFVVCGFEHSVANMYYFSAALFSASKHGITGYNVGTAIVNNLIPVTLGNVVGGVVFVAIPYWLVYLKKSKKEKENDSKEITATVVDKNEK